ncbi:COG4223 family protein [Methylocapsa aurea]|uniref:COG4223 family protein n=1 Tax=Methylocapsa aurea TaxID=663610 RepID=UPI00055FD36A|nr:hypothetical protein [Methylocapsa aurea]
MQADQKPAPEANLIGSARSTPEQTGSRSSLPLFAAAIVTSAVLAVGGAFGLRYFDGSGSATAAFDERMAAANARADAIGSKTDSSIAALRAAVTTLERRVGVAESAAGKAASDVNSALSEMQKTLAARLASLARAAGGATAELVDLGPLQTRIEAIELKLGSLETALAAPKADVRAQQDRESASAEPNSQVQAIAIVAESLLRKLDRGAPFSTELAALENLGVGPAELAPLRPVAGAGVVSPRKLADEFSALASPILASEPASEDAGIIDRLTRNAANLVRVRRVGEAGANDPDLPGLVARIENALKRLDIEEAFTIWTELPSAAKAKSDSWGEAAKARLGALSAARSIEADAVAALGKPKS